MGEWRYSSTILDLGIRWRWVVSFTLRPLYPGEKSPPYIPIGWEAWVPEPVWTLWRREISCLTRNRTPAVQPIARLYTDWSIPTPIPHTWESKTKQRRLRSVWEQTLNVMVTLCWESWDGTVVAYWSIPRRESNENIILEDSAQVLKLFLLA
jgi:hypothetical protein